MAKPAFDQCSAAYALYRPGYPAELVDAICTAAAGPGDVRAADIGAGTGILTRLLADRGLSVIAVEPSISMAVEMNKSGIEMRAHQVCATAEQIALADRSVSLVSCGQSFHWFNPPYALAEFARILRPDGILALIWNNRDLRSPFVQAFEKLVSRWNQAYRCEYRRQDWAGKVAQTGLFTPLTLTTVESLWRMSQEAFVGFTRSVSYIRNVLSRESLPRFEDELRDLLHRHFSDGDCLVPLVTELWMCRRN